MNQLLSRRAAWCVPLLLALTATVALASPASASTVAGTPLMAVGTKTTIAIVVVLIAAVAGGIYWFTQRSK